MLPQAVCSLVPIQSEGGQWVWWMAGGPFAWAFGKLSSAIRPSCVRLRVEFCLCSLCRLWFSFRFPLPGLFVFLLFILFSGFLYFSKPEVLHFGEVDLSPDDWLHPFCCSFLG